MANIQINPTNILKGKPYSLWPGIINSSDPDNQEKARQQEEIDANYIFNFLEERPGFLGLLAEMPECMKEYCAWYAAGVYKKWGGYTFQKNDSRLLTSLLNEKREYMIGEKSYKGKYIGWLVFCPVYKSITGTEPEEEMKHFERPQVFIYKRETGQTKVVIRDHNKTGRNFLPPHQEVQKKYALILKSILQTEQAGTGQICTTEQAEALKSYLISKEGVHKFLVDFFDLFWPICGKPKKDNPDEPNIYTANELKLFLASQYKKRPKQADADLKEFVKSLELRGDLKPDAGLEKWLQDRKKRK